jgi:hypothetical protein
MEFSARLVDASAAMLQCGILIERRLKKTLDIAEKCEPGIALVIADTLTKLTRDIGAAPLFFSKLVQRNGQLMLRIVEVMAWVLSATAVQELKGAAFLEDKVYQLCRSKGLPAEVGTLFALLCREISRVFSDLRVVLKRENSQHAKQLYRSMQHYIRDVQQPILCFSFNSLKLRVCMQAVRDCKGRQAIEKGALKRIGENLLALKTKARVMAILAAYHHQTMTRAMKQIDL